MTTALASRTSYDGLGRPVDTWSPALVTFASVASPTRSHAVLDRLGNQTETTLNYNPGATETATGDWNVRSTFRYDVAGELLQYCPARALYSPGCDITSTGETRAWHYEFDALGRQTKTIPPVNVTATALATTESVYEADGHLLKTCRYPAGGSCGTYDSRHTDFEYDALGRVKTQKTYDRGPSPAADVLKFTKTAIFNVDGSQASVTEGSDTLTWVYDAAGRLSQLKRGSTALTAYSYTAGTGTVASRTDGAMGQTSFGYDWARRETSITPPSAYYSGGSVSRTYRLDGLLATQAFPASLTETLSYDPVKRPTGISLNTAGGTSSLSQAYDRAGRVASEGRSLQGITGDPGTGTQAFAYDGLSRATGSSGLSHTYSYTYDLDGDRLTSSDGLAPRSFAYDWTAEITTTSFAYDRYGNLIASLGDDSVVTAYSYDEASRLTSISPAGGTAATLTLDALDRPKTRTVGASTDTYSYTGPSSTAYETGNATTDALLDLDGSRLAVKTAGTVAWVVFDLHGSVAALCPAGTTSLSDAYRYDPWGKPISSGTTVNPWRYRGALDLSPDLANPILVMGARLYAPVTGTFTSEDSVQGRAANPLSMNRFLYAEADPTTLVDPSGHYAMTMTGGTGCQTAWSCATVRQRAAVTRTQSSFSG